MSDSQRPHGLQPTRLLRPWDFPGKSPGVGCHCLLRSDPLHGDKCIDPPVPLYPRFHSCRRHHPEDAVLLQCLLSFWFYYLFSFWLCHMACRILVPLPGTECRPTAVKTQSNHWTTRESPIIEKTPHVSGPMVQNPSCSRINCI